MGGAGAGRVSAASSCACTLRVLLSRALAKRGMDEAQVCSREEARAFSREDSAETLHFPSAFVIRYSYTDLLSSGFLSASRAEL